MPEGAGGADPLLALRQHVRDAREAAERLAQEHGRGAGAPQSAGGEPPPGARPQPPPGAHQEVPRAGAPPRGWDAPESAPDTGGELRALVALLESLRDALPEELREQLNELIVQILLLMRAVIDWLVAQLDTPPAAPGPAARLQDIPIA